MRFRWPWLSPLVLPVAGGCHTGEAERERQARLERTLAAWSDESVAAPPRPPPEAEAPAPPVLADPEGLAGRHLVILDPPPATSPAAPIEAALAAHPDLLAQVAHVQTTSFCGLMPCHRITIAGAFEHRRQATALARRLDALGIASHLAEAGTYLGPQEAVAAWCRREPLPRGPQGCGDVRFAEVHDGRAWLWLGLDEGATTAALAELPAPTPLGGLDTWASAVAADELGGHRRGDRWRLFAPGSARGVGTCRVAGFAALTRGVPHDTYLHQDPAPTAPGCGTAEVFARLDCRAPLDEPLLAMRPGGLEPVLYTALAPLRDIELEDDAKAIVSGSPAFLSAVERANGAAAQRSAPLQQLIALTGYVARGRKVLLVRVFLQTGDGVTGCGHDDVRVELAAVHEWTAAGRLGAPLVPLHPLQDTAVLGLVDIDADGTPELFERAWPGTLRISAGRDPAPCQLEQGYCGCPC